MIINHNINAMNAHRYLVNNTQDSGKVLEKLSSGLKINRGSDDAAGLAVSEKMRGQIRGLSVAQRNTQDGISLLQTAEGHLQEMTSAIHRMRELAVQAANGIYTSEDRGYIQQEVNQLTQEVQRIAKDSQFNKNSLFLGDFASEYEKKGLDGSRNGGEATAAAPAAATTTGGYGLPIHVGANMEERVFLTISEMTASKLGLAEPAKTAASAVDSRTTEVISKIDLKTADSANTSLNVLDGALEKVNAERTRLGAYQNRLEMTMRGIGVAVENLQASESRVRDTDMAKEMIDFVKFNILNQASTSMLAQANLQPQLILRVLG